MKSRFIVGGQNHGPYAQRPNWFAPSESYGFCAGM